MNRHFLLQNDFDFDPFEQILGLAVVHPLTPIRSLQLLKELLLRHASRFPPVWSSVRIVKSFNLGLRERPVVDLNFIDNPFKIFCRRRDPYFASNGHCRIVQLGR